MPLERFGPYKLVRCIAIGGMGELFLAQREGIAGFSKLLVVKRIRDPYAANPDFISMFLNEGRVAALLDHPNIVHIYELGEVDGQYFLAMEYVPGKNLAAIREKLEGPLPIPLALYTIGQLCEALSFAHAASDTSRRSLKLVHRDVSPPNILISFSGAVKLTDFGIAKVIQSQQTAAGILKGKLAYLSPEQARGEPLDKRSDIFALGLVLFEATTGHRAVPGDADTEIIYAVANGRIRRPSQYAKDYPPELEKIYLKATAKDRQRRYQDAKELQEDLLAFQMHRRMIVTAAKMGAFMQKEFQSDARAAGEALYDTLGDQQAQPPVSQPTMRSPARRRPSGQARSAVDTARETDPRPSPAPLPASPDESARSSQRMTAAGPLRPPTGPTASPRPRPEDETEQWPSHTPFVADEYAPTPAVEPEPAKEVVVGAGSEPAIPPVLGRRYTGEDNPTLLAMPAQSMNDLMAPTVTEHPVAQDAGHEQAPGQEGWSGSSDPAIVRAGRPLTGPSVMASVTEETSRTWRPAVILLTALVTLVVGFGGFLWLAPAEGAPAWVKDLRQLLGLDRAPVAHAVAPRDGGGAADTAVVPRADLAKEDASDAGAQRVADSLDAASRLARDLSAPGASSDLGPQAVAPRGGKLEIVASPRLVAVVDGRRVGITPVTVRVSAGNRTVRLSSGRHRISIVRRVRVDPGKPALLNITVRRGRLVVRARPWAHVFVDGVKRGTTPMRPIWLYEGRHKVKLVNADAPKPYTTTVTVSPGRTSRVVHRFE